MYSVTRSQSAPSLFRAEPSNTQLLAQPPSQKINTALSKKLESIANSAMPLATIPALEATAISAVDRKNIAEIKSNQSLRNIACLHHNATPYLRYCNIGRTITILYNIDNQNCPAFPYAKMICEAVPKNNAPVDYRARGIKFLELISSSPIIFDSTLYAVALNLGQKVNERRLDKIMISHFDNLYKFCISHKTTR
ncbi:hypothetical protein [Iodobacter ciconiae]|uniref:Uncharacterized protein n=1 Tax=Iodobacter ciconiae TaxID=2496266 RepID=A0A3S8ZUD9_9NEIS|nr:hypothetical protein [Iodobacter ciconiae]AZN37055.1 hypothetical protein EJO50_11530 [Iodobacter ciconiae]